MKINMKEWAEEIMLFAAGCGVVAMVIYAIGYFTGAI